MIEVRAPRDEREVEAALALREEVFCGEQGVSLADERDGRDGEAVHLVAVEDGRVLGTCRLLLEGTAVKLGRMAEARHEFEKAAALTRNAREKALLMKRAEACQG